MAAFCYRGEAGRHYPSLGVAPEPGEVVELDEAPEDGRWEPTADSPPATSPAEPAEAGKE